MQASEDHISKVSTPPRRKERKLDYVSDFYESAYLYGRISLENVDPILVEHIKISIETFNERHSVFSEIEQEISKIEAGSQRIINYCRAYGKVEDTEQKRASLLVASSPLILRRRNLTKLKKEGQIW